MLLNWIDAVNPVTVATTICCHGCQTWVLVFGKGSSACQNPFKPQAGISLPLLAIVMCWCRLWCIRLQRCFQQELYYSLHLDNGPVLFVCQTCDEQALREQEPGSEPQKMYTYAVCVKHWFTHAATQTWTRKSICCTDLQIESTEKQHLWFSKEQPCIKGLLSQSASLSIAVLLLYIHVLVNVFKFSAVMQ